MKSTESYTIHPKYLKNAQARRQAQTRDCAATPKPAPTPATASTVRTTPQDFANPVDYQHPYESMGRFAQALALRYDANRTRNAYYCQVRLVHALFFAAVSGALSEKLETAKRLRATTSGFTAVLHTWNHQLGSHSHIHCLVPGAGLNER